MADKTYKLNFEMTDGTTQTVQFTVPQGDAGQPGADGADGVSPVVSVSAITGGHRITITDAKGTETFDVMDGEDGSPGSNGKNGNGIKSAVLNADYTLTLTFDDGTSYTTPSIRGATGAAGKDGVDGQDGYTPVKGVDYFDGVNGKDGADGYTPVKGKDYFDGEAGKDGTSVTVKSVSTSTADGGNNVVTFSDGKTLTVKNGSKGIAGEQGYSFVTSVSRPSFTEAQWATYGEIGRSENWSNSSSVRNGCRIGDIFTVVGTATDTKNAHVAYFRCETASGDMRGTCIAHSIAERGAAGSDANVTTASITNALGYTPMNPNEYAVSVKALGAKGNGSTDDTAVFQSALANNRKVYVPGGTYILSGELVIGMNCQLELAQDAFLDFKQTSGNCISMRAGSNIIGNHATINVPYAFTGKVINIYAGIDSGIFGVPPLNTGKWGPMWAAARYITDLHIIKLNSGGVARSVDGKCSGTAVYLRASHQDAMNFLWAVDLNKLRIAGGFTYGIHLDSDINPTDPMDGWIHQTKIDGFITGCEVAVYLKDSTLSYISVRIVPDWGTDNNAVYCKHGIVLENSTNVDLSQSRVMDWDSNHTLWTEGGQYQHLALLGNCAGLILNEQYYYDWSNYDIRSLIYTDTPSNLEKLVVLQEPITRWFKGKEGIPYFNNGYVEKKLLLQEEFEECFALERLPDFEDALSKSIDKDGKPFNNGLGYYPYGKRWAVGSGTLSDDAEYHGCTGLIPIKAGDTLYTSQITWQGDGIEGAVIFDSNFNRITSCVGNTVQNMTYFFGYATTDEGFALTLKPISDLANAAYIAITFGRAQIGDNPLISVNVPMTFSQHGFLADSVEVKSEKVYGLENTVNRLINAAIGDALDNVGKGIIYIEGDSTTTGTWTGTSNEITSYYDGLVIAYKTNIAGISDGTTLNINGLGAAAVIRNASSAVTTHYPVGSVLILTYSGGSWLTADYDANTKNSAGTSNKTGSKMYLVGATSQTSSGTTTYTNTNTYIGTDNCLYSGGKKVYTSNDLTDITNSVIAALPIYEGEVV